MAEATPTPQPEARHTPGDWYYDGKRYVRESASDATIALVCEDDGHCESDRAQPMPMAANGNLIAAAPDLLAVCEEIIEHETDDWDARMRTIRAAVAKAKGGAA
jgi:hypothetical protein